MFNTVELYFDGFIDKSGARMYECESGFASKKYVDIVACFAKEENMSLDSAMDFI